MLERGRVAAQGPAAHLRADGALVEAYLGGTRSMVSTPAIVFAAREEPAS